MTGYEAFVRALGGVGRIRIYSEYEPLRVKFASGKPQGSLPVRLCLTTRRSGAAECGEPLIFLLRVGGVDLSPSVKPCSHGRRARAAERHWRSRSPHPAQNHAKNLSFRKGLLHGAGGGSRPFTFGETLLPWSQGKGG